jgi:hypothetical protein
MLHRPAKEGLICITQPTHAWISGCLARAWGNEQFGYFAPTEEVCLGAEQHDIGWLTWEKSPTLNPKTGYPHNFMQVPTAVHVDLWSNAKHLVLPIGRYIALLVSLHGSGLYERHRSWENSPESSQIVQNFLESEYAFQKQLIANLQKDPHYTPYTTLEAIARNRQLVATWDALSLALCHKVQDEQQIDHVPTAEGETTLTLTPVDNDFDRISVSPWPFQQSEVTLVYEGRILHSTFTDEAAMREALVDAPWIAITNTLIP